jgi:hypothetical protein
MIQPLPHHGLLEFSVLAHELKQLLMVILSNAQAAQRLQAFIKTGALERSRLSIHDPPVPPLFYHQGRGDGPGTRAQPVHYYGPRRVDLGQSESGTWAHGVFHVTSRLTQPGLAQQVRGNSRR